MRMRSALAVAFALSLAGVLLAASASPAWAKNVFASNGCGTSEYQPKAIIFSCADGKLMFEATQWTLWNAASAEATGLLQHPDLDHPSCARKPIAACPWSEAEASATLSRPVFCSTNGRWQFTRLKVVAPKDPDPTVREMEADYSCGEYDRPKPPRPARMFLGAHRAASYMREALRRRSGLYFDASYARRVQCSRRVARDRLRCKMSWIVGDLAYSGRGMIWITYENGRRFWNYSYRITRFNEYCAVIEAPDCTKVFTAR